MRLFIRGFNEVQKFAGVPAVSTLIILSAALPPSFLQPEQYVTHSLSIAHLFIPSILECHYVLAAATKRSRAVQYKII